MGVSGWYHGLWAGEAAVRRVVMQCRLPHRFLAGRNQNVKVICAQVVTCLRIIHSFARPAADVPEENASKDYEQEEHDKNHNDQNPERLVVVDP